MTSGAGSATASRYLAQPTPSFWKSLRYLSDARLTVAALLLAYVPLLGRESALERTFDSRLFLEVCAIYFAIAIGCSVIHAMIRASGSRRIRAEMTLVSRTIIRRSLPAAGWPRAAR